MQTFSYENAITRGMKKSYERAKQRMIDEGEMHIRDWIVIAGSLIDTTKGGGFEFFGPFTEEEANFARGKLSGETLIAVQLLKLPHLLGEHWKPTHKPQSKP